MKDCRLVLFTLQDTLSLQSPLSSMHKSITTIAIHFVIGGFLQGESSVGGVAGGRCSLLGGGRSLEATNTWC